MSKEDQEQQKGDKNDQEKEGMPEPRPKFSRLLVAIDGSEIADYALNLAIHVAEKYPFAKLDLLYVLAPSGISVTTPVFDPMYGGQMTSPVPAGIGASQYEMKKVLSKGEALLDERRKIVLSSGLACETISVSSDDVAGQIVKLGSGAGYDLIVVGSRGLSGLKSLILGSVSKKVAREAKVPVLVVKSRIDSLPKILLAYDGSPESRKALAVAVEVGEKFRAEVDPMSVVNIPLSPEGYVISDVDRWEAETRSHIDEAIAILKAAGVEKVEGRLADSVDVSRALSEEALRGGYDLIIVGSRGMGRLKSLFLGSVASGVADTSKTNVLIAR